MQDLFSNGYLAGPAFGGNAPFERAFWLNDAGIQLDAAKQEELPPGVDEIEGYRETFKADGDTFAVRHFAVPWERRKAFADWALGYSYATTQMPDGTLFNPYTSGGLDSESNPYFGGGFSRFNGEAEALGLPARLVRIIPSQHPEMPWLYAVECDLVQPCGAMDRRRDITVRRDAAGQPYIAWDNSAPTPDQLPLDQFPAVAEALSRYNALNDRLTLLTTFPDPDDGQDVIAFEDRVASFLRDPAVNPGGDDFPALQTQLGLGAAALGEQLRRLAEFESEGGLAALQALSPAQLAAFPVAVAYLNELRVLRSRVDAALQAIQPAVDLAYQQALARAEVPMARYRTWDGRARLLREGLAHYAVTYRSVPYRVRTDRDLAEGGFAKGELERHVTRRKTWATKALQMPPPGTNDSLKFTAGPYAGVDVPVPGSIPFPLRELEYTWHQVPDVPEDAIDACEGTLNAAPFDGARGFRNYPRGTLLFQSPTVKELPRGLRGRVQWEITYRFLYNKRGWNNFPAANRQWYAATFGGAANGPTVFEHADFDALFVPPYPVDYQTNAYG